MTDGQLIHLYIEDNNTPEEDLKFVLEHIDDIVALAKRSKKQVVIWGSKSMGDILGMKYPAE